MWIVESEGPLGRATDNLLKLAVLLAQLKWDRGGTTPQARSRSQLPQSQTVPQGPPVRRSGRTAVQLRLQRREGRAGRESAESE